MGTPHMGRILWVDLTRGTLQEESLPASFYARQISGLGLAVAFNRETSDRRARPVLARPRDCIACRFCALECPAAAVTMNPFSQMTAK